MKSVRLRCLIGLIAVYLVGCQIQKFPPELWKPNPATGAIGQDVTLEGAQFGDNPSVTFTSEPKSVTGQIITVPASVKTKTDAAITVTVPRLPVGVVQVRVSNGVGITDPVAFSVLQPAPVLTSISPGNALPGAKVRLTGDFLDQLNNVKFGLNTFYPGVNSVTLVSPQTIDLILPDGIPRGLQAVSVETVGGIAKGEFIVSGTPEISSIAPKRVKAGTELIIQGRNFTDGVVRINGLLTDKTQTTFRDTEIRTLVPTAATSGKVTVTVFEKLIATSTDSLVVVGAPVIAANGLSLTEGIKGDKVLLTGTALLDVSAVSFGTTPAQFRVLNNTSIEVTVPERNTSGEVPITITSLGGTTSSTQLFLVILAPTALTFDPARQLRGQDVTIRGQNLYRITSVSVNGQTVPIVGRTEGSSVRITLPADASSGGITVVNRAGAANATKNLTVISRPVITDFTKKGQISTRVVIKGNYLADALIYFAGNNYPAVDDGKNEDTERWVTVTGDAQTGPIRLVNEAGETSTVESFTVLRSITSIDFTPKMAKIGADVTITGQNLSDVTDIRFSNGKSAAAIFRRSGNTLIATVPVGAVDGTICLTNANGQVCSSATFNVQLPPSMLDFTPKTGKAGTDITITGQNIADVTEIRFNGGKSAPAVFVKKTATSLLVTIPADAVDGTICLTNPAATVCTATGFVLTK